MNPDVGIPYNAYSRSGDITAPLVYANGGNPEDYDLLEKHGIDVKGKIALVRYSFPYSYRGFKALTAEKRGLAGLLIYSDPKEDGEARGAVFPDGPWGPLSHIQRGGIPYDFIYPGDPLTPEWASKPGARRLSPEKPKPSPRSSAFRSRPKTPVRCSNPWMEKPPPQPGRARFRSPTVFPVLKPRSGCGSRWKTR